MFACQGQFALFKKSKFRNARLFFLVYVYRRSVKKVIWHRSVCLTFKCGVGKRMQTTLFSWRFMLKLYYITAGCLMLSLKALIKSLRKRYLNIYCLQQNIYSFLYSYMLELHTTTIKLISYYFDNWLIAFSGKKVKNYLIPAS